MELLTVLVPVGMLGLLLALGRYEEWLLPRPKEQDAPPPAAPVH
ncbi:hypothetical protein [Streptomyces sp. VRA16 Mangrove soil]|nr:hypothetical protein [Streptomyces sp. VRA16 Mangrove soil]